MAQEFKTGDLVMLKSGGPVMTVNFEENRKVCCTWFQGGGYVSETFKPEMLRECPPPSPSTAIAVDMKKLSDEELERLAQGKPLVEVPPGQLTQQDLERMTGEQLVSLVRSGRIMPAGPVIFLPEEDPEGKC